jgi:chromosome segregation ATPase
MKRDFLKNLGIEDKDIIDKIMDENSSDIGKAKGELQTYKDKVTELEGAIATKDSEIANLTKKAGDTDALNQKIAQLEADKTSLTTELSTKVNEIQKDHAIEGKIRDAKGKNVKAIKALLDHSKITYENNELNGLDDQLEALKGAEDSSMLFGEVHTPPAGTNPNNPPAGSGGTPPTSNSLAEAVAKALSGNK